MARFYNYLGLIVTAAVHRGFSLMREHRSSTFRPRAGVSPYTSAFALAETCVFSKQSVGPFLCGPPELRTSVLHPRGPSFSRSYGGILPSSLTILLSIALESSSHLPESVCGTGTSFWLEGCLGSLESATSPCCQGSASHLGVNAPRIFLRDRLPAYTGTSNRPLYLSFFGAPSLITNFGGTGIMTSCPSPTLFSLGLGPANPGTINLAQETLGFRRTPFSRVSRFSFRP